MPTEPVLDATHRAFLAQSRRAVLGTIGHEGRPRLVPCCFVLDDEQAFLYTPLDDKPKRVADPMALARIRDIAADPRVTVLVDRWDEDWTRLGWLRCEGTADLVAPIAPEHAPAIAALRARYPQYREHRIETRPLIRVTIERSVAWGALD